MAERSPINTPLGRLNNQAGTIAVRVGRLMVFVVLIVTVYFILQEYGVLTAITETEKLKSWIADIGYTGPFVIMALMAMAVIINPIPSAPIALAAGAAYGHTWGTFYVVVGATIGAMGAFTIARILGQELLVKLFGNNIMLGWMGSQNILTGLVFVSRLIPFLSFDLVSYGAGLTQIHVWRFFLATLTGLIPASFLLAHFGGEMATANLNEAMLWLLILGGITVIPIAMIAYYRRA